MIVYIIKTTQKDIHGVYKHEKTAEFVKNNLNQQLVERAPLDFRYYIESYEIRDDY